MLSRDLLDLADQLAKLGSTRPKQAVLRRAISTAYYGVFHFLIEQATKELAGVRGTDANLRAFLARGVSHAGLKSICKSIGAGNWPSSIEKRIGKGALGLRPRLPFAASAPASSTCRNCVTSPTTIPRDDSIELTRSSKSDQQTDW